MKLIINSIVILFVLLLQGCNTSNEYFHEARDKDGNIMFDDYGRKLYYYSNFVVVQTKRGEVEVDKDSGEVISRFAPKYYYRLEAR